MKSLITSAEELKSKSSASSELRAGIKNMLLATFFFSLMNAAVKKVAHIPTMEVVFFRCFIATCIALVTAQRLKLNWIGSNRKLLILRGTFGTIALYAFFLSIQKMPLATAMTIQYLSPIFTTVIAIFLLGEQVRPLQWLFFLISFAGAFVIKGFDTRISFVYLLVAIASAFFSGLAYNMVRSLKEKEHHLVVVLHFQFIGVIAGFAFSIFNWTTPSGIDWLWLTLTGVLAHLGQIHLTKSLHNAQVSSVSILNYAGIVYGLLLGYFLFGETYTLQTIIGIALVVSGVVLSIFYQKREAVLPVEATEA
jgi:drug/metabolite transporter (DMT)-like permease